jgi:HAD superfamily phosphatase (TIGR01681 family)
MAQFVDAGGRPPGSVGQAGPPTPAEAAPARPAALAKVVVWDLDETLWTGTLAEVGAEGVTVRPEAEATVRALDARGVLQSVASKNDPAEALAALERFGLAEFFLHPQVGWGPKSGAVARIARALDLGLDSFVFLDDQPFERGEVTDAHPGVRALPERRWLISLSSLSCNCRRRRRARGAARCTRRRRRGGLRRGRRGDGRRGGIPRLSAAERDRAADRAAHVRRCGARL